MKPQGFIFILFFAGGGLSSYLLGVLVFRSNARGFNSLLPLCYDKLGAPRPIAFRLRGQDPLLILALGGLCNGSGGLLLLLLLRLLLFVSVSVLALSCPGAEKRDPPYPPLVDSPSLPTPCEDREDGYTTRGGRLGILFPPFGFGDCQTLLPRGSCFVFPFRFLCGWLFKPFR